MQAQVVVWNVDARYRPELEVSLEIAADEDEQVEQIQLELDDLEDPTDDEILASPWFVDDGVPIVDELRVIHDSPPTGYAQAYRARCAA
jgi:hypothetical protein